MSASPEPAARPPAPRTGHTPALRTVLVVDDESAVRDVVRTLLESDGYEVLAAPDGRSALEAFRAARERIRAVLLDVTMPDISGAEVCRQLRVLAPGTPVILSSGRGPESLQLDFAGDRGVSFLNKPYRRRELIAALHAACDAASAG